MHTRRSRFLKPTPTPLKLNLDDTLYDGPSARTRKRSGGGQGKREGYEMRESRYTKETLGSTRTSMLTLKCFVCFFQ